MGFRYAVADPTFQPALRLINAITNAHAAVVTTSFAHNYLDGMIVRFYVPDGYGMRQINQKTGTIIVLGSDSFSVDIDSLSFDPFLLPNPTPVQEASVVPIGEINSILRAATRNVLPSGTFE
jgi:hypothetical protein